MSNAFGRRPHINPRPDVTWGKDEGFAARKEGDDNIVRRPLTGARDNNRGNSKPFNLIGDNTYREIPITSIVNSPQSSGPDAESIMVTCGIGFDKDFDYAAGDSYTIQGILEWGIGGATFSTRFDWMNGTCFAIAASSINVKAAFSYLMTSDRVLTLKAALAYGGAPSMNASPLRLTHDPIPLPPATLSDRIPIPAFASAVALTASDFGFVTGPDFVLAFFGSGGQQVIYTWDDNSNGAHQADGAIPIPGWATAYAILNKSPSTQVVYPIFTLAL